MAETEDLFERFKRNTGLDPATDFGGAGADLSNYYTKPQVNSLLSDKADVDDVSGFDTRIDFVEPHVTDIAYAATVTPNASLGNHFRLNLEGNITINAPTNLKEGQRILFEFVNDGGGSKIVTMDAVYKFSASVFSSVEISSGDGDVDYYGGVANKEATEVRMIARAQGF